MDDAKHQTTAQRLNATRRERAVAMVDRRHGYTLEFALDPGAPRLAYDEQEQDLAYSEAGIGQRDCNIT